MREDVGDKLNMEKYYRGRWFRKVQMGEKGQSLVEFSLVLPVLLLVLMGIIELGYLAHNHLALANSAREGARAAAVGKEADDIDLRAHIHAESLSVVVVKEYSSDNGTTWQSWPADTMNGSGDGVNGVPNGSLVRVSVLTEHQQLTGFLPYINGMQLSQFVVMRREPS